jgi:hypothetical protein
VRQQGKKLGRPKVSPKIEAAIREHLGAGYGILKVAAIVGVGSGTVQRVKREMVAELAAATCAVNRVLAGDRGAASTLPVVVLAETPIGRRGQPTVANLRSKAYGHLAACVCCGA